MERTGVHHNAADDAESRARHLVAMLKGAERRVQGPATRGPRAMTKDNTTEGRSAVAGPLQRPVGRLAPERRADGMPASADERHLRRLLAQRVGMPHTYYDDGEAQGQEHGISIDFMRGSWPTSTPSCGR